MLDCRASESEILGHALWNAGRVKTLIGAIGQTRYGATSAEQLTAQLNITARRAQARPVHKKIDLAGRIARMSDAGWWTRNLRRELVRENEGIEHAAGLVRKRGQCYVSDHAVKVKGERAKANRATLDRLEVANENGEAFNLLEVSDASVSNPALRRAELMTRCRGFEETAEFFGHVAQFFTFTCPSRFHRFTAGAKPNPKWTGATPKDGQNYLCQLWAKVRAAWKRAGYVPYGFRVAEPHHDGCPHWHVLLFMPGEFAAGVANIARRFALQDSPNEPGAIKHRFTNEKIDTTKGSATGYIAKYICKNIDGIKEDGEALGLDFASGTHATSAATRVRTWASVHGIRQFQQIGGPSVTVWRELRRLGKDAEPCQLELFEKPRGAANRGAWFDFWMLQGGPEVARANLSLKPFYETTTGGKYGDTMDRIKGVHGQDASGEYMEPTRLHDWTVQRAGLADVNAQAADFVDYMDRQKAIKAFLNSAGIRDLREFHDREAGAWTGVNNCTPEPAPAFNFAAVEGMEPRPKPGAPVPNGARSLVFRMGTPDEVAPELRIAEKNQRDIDRIWPS